MSRGHIITTDPEVLSQRIDKEAEYTEGEGEKQAELKAVQFKTDKGEVVTLERGIDLFNSSGVRVGSVTEIKFSETANQTGGRSTDWHHTVKIDCGDDVVSDSGVPLGELAQQWDDKKLTTIREALAEYGNRKLLLWEIASNGRDFCGVQFTAREHGLGDQPVQERVEAFVDDMLIDGEIRPEYDDGINWEKLESTHGSQANLYL